MGVQIETIRTKNNNVCESRVTQKLLLLTLLCFYINGFAFNWKQVVVDRSGDFYYIDVDNIKRQNELLYYSRFEDYPEPKNGDHSFIRKFKADCIEGKSTWSDDTFYNKPMNKGKIIGEINPK